MYVCVSRCWCCTTSPVQWTMTTWRPLWFYHVTSTVKAANAKDPRSTWHWHRPTALSLSLSVSLSLSLFLSLPQDSFMYALVHFHIKTKLACGGRVHWKDYESLLNHRPITTNTRQSVQRLHKHMATSKAPRMPRPRDFWVNAMASMSKLAPKKST